MKRLVVVVVVGIVVFVAATFVGRRGAADRFALAQEQVTGECRTYRQQASKQHAGVCRGYDQFEPKAIPERAAASLLFEQAGKQLAQGDTSGAERSLTRAIHSVDDLERMGTLIASLVAGSIVNETLDLLAAHPELDAASIVRGVHLEEARHPFESERLQHRWLLAHWNMEPGISQRSNSDLLDALAAEDTAYREMDRALVERGDVAACEEAATKRETRRIAAPDLCTKMQGLLRAAARLDAAQHGRLSSARR